MTTPTPTTTKSATDIADMNVDVPTTTMTTSDDVVVADGIQTNDAAAIVTQTSEDGGNSGRGSSDNDGVNGDGDIELGASMTDVTKIPTTPKTNTQDDGMTIAGTDISDGLNLPDFLLCPITRELLKDPVVLQDGLSYERSAVLEQKPNEPIMYPNRALAQLLTELHAHSVITSAGTKGNTVVNNNTSFIPKQSLLKQAKQFLTAQEDRPLPQALYCPITLGIMHEAVIDPSGVSYEKVAIVNWIRVNGDSPVTRKELTVEELVPNRSIEQLLQNEVNRDDIDDIHPALRRWKNEPVPRLAAIPSQRSTLSTGSNGNDTPLESGPAAASSSGRTVTNTNAMSFPTTRRELEEAQMQRMRRRQNRMKCRIAFVIFFLGIIVASFFIPILAAIVVVLLICIVCFFMSDSTYSRRF